MPIPRKGPLEPTESVIDRNDSGDDSGAGLLVRQPHGGAIKQGGNVGNRGGMGAVPSAIRERLRGSFAQRITVLEAIADDPDLSPADRIRALDLMARYGIGTDSKVEVDAPNLARIEKVIYLPELDTEIPPRTGLRVAANGDRPIPGMPDST
jgi:hypothetical protein